MYHRSCEKDSCPMKSPIVSHVEERLVVMGNVVLRMYWFEGFGC